MIHLAIADVVNDAHDNEFWMTVPALAAKARCSERTVQRTLADLVAGGMLTIVRQGGPKEGATVYRFEMPTGDIVAPLPGLGGDTVAPQVVTPRHQGGDTLSPVTKGNRTTTQAARRDELFESVCAICDLDLSSLTTSERGRVNRACAELRQLRPTPTALDVEAFGRNWRRSSRFAITPQTITGNWQRVMRAGDRQAAAERQRLADMGVIS